MIPKWIILALIPSIIVIGYIDYLVMSRWWKCDNCGYERTKWYMWIMPTTLEILLFLGGIAIGYILK